MNSFFFDVKRRVYFYGRLNEDVNMYTYEGRRGRLFLTILGAFLNQGNTQQNEWGLTDAYLNLGTYVKSFYSILYCPSAVKISILRGNRYNRIHHRVSWDNAAPKILREEYRKV